MILKLNFHFKVIGGNYKIVILCGALMSVCFLESIYVTMSEQCKKISFNLLFCLSLRIFYFVLIIENFSFLCLSLRIWGFGQPSLHLLQLSQLYKTAKCQKLFYTKHNQIDKH